MKNIFPVTYSALSAGGLNHLHTRGAGAVYPLLRRDGTYTGILQAPEGKRCAALDA